MNATQRQIDGGAAFSGTHDSVVERRTKMSVSHRYRSMTDFRPDIPPPGDAPQSKVIDAYVKAYRTAEPNNRVARGTID